MVNRRVLRKLSNKELETYLQEGSCFVPDAVQMAFEILEERGRVFSELEKAAVQQLIQHKNKKRKPNMQKKSKPGKTISQKIRKPSSFTHK